MRNILAWIAGGVVAAMMLVSPSNTAHAKAVWGKIGKYDVHVVGTPRDRWIIVTDPTTGDKHYGHEHTGHGFIANVGITNNSPATLLFTDGMGGATPIGPGGSQFGPHISGSNLHIDLAGIGPIDAAVNKDIIIDLPFDGSNPADPVREWQFRLQFGGHGVSGLDGARLFVLERDSAGNELGNLFTDRFGFDYLPIDYSDGYVDIMFVPPMMVPEPSSIAYAATLGAFGLAGAALRRRRRKARDLRASQPA